MGDLVVKHKLRSICCCNEWSYGVFWSYQQRNTMLLTFKDAYYEEQVAEVVESLLPQVHRLGEGIVGQVAFTGMRQWMFLDDQSGYWKSTGNDMVKASMLDCQISCGIKTIAVICIEPWGVLQFGSTEKVLESMEFLNQTQMLFQDVAYIDGLLPMDDAPSPLECGANDNSGLLGSIIASRNSADRHHSGEHSQTSSLSRSQQERMNFTLGEQPLINTQQHIMYAEAQVLLSDKQSTESQQQLSGSVYPSCPTALSCEGSIITSIQPHFSSEMTLPHDMPSTGAISPAFCGGTENGFQGDSTFNPSDSLGEYISTENFEGNGFSNLITSPFLTPLFDGSEVIFPDMTTCELTFPEGNKPADLVESLSEFFTMDDISQWFVHSPSHTYPQSVAVSSISSILTEGDLFSSNHVTLKPNSVQNSLTDTLDSSAQEKLLNVHVAGRSKPTAIESKHEQVKSLDLRKDQIMPIKTGTHAAITAAESDCVSELIASSVVPRRGLFSELGIDELLEGTANSNVATSSFHFGSSTSKRRKVESSQANCGQVELGSLPCSARSVTAMPDQGRCSLLPKKGILQKIQGLWIDDSYSINVETGVGTKSKPSEESTKVSRRRARPGESTRPRPKDRQQIQDRIKELRGMVPNGQKSSIDSLLDRTIKYMLFLQSVTKYSDRLTQAYESKLIDHENGVILKDGNTNSSSRGATWAYEVGNQTTVCPIIVEDLSPPGQMLIEMLCEDQGIFLEIADVLRDMGLNILKGMMEVQGTKLRASFTVEAQRKVTRRDIFWSLVRLLQDRVFSDIHTTDQTKIYCDSHLPSSSSYQQQPPVSLPIS